MKPIFSLEHLGTHVYQLTIEFEPYK